MSNQQAREYSDKKKKSEMTRLKNLKWSKTLKIESISTGFFAL